MAETQYFIPVCFLGKGLDQSQMYVLVKKYQLFSLFPTLFYLVVNAFLKEALTFYWLVIPLVASWIFPSDSENLIFALLFGSCVSLTSVTMIFSDSGETSHPSLDC